MKRLEVFYRSIKILTNLFLTILALTCAYIVGRGILVLALNIGLPAVIAAWIFHIVGTIIIGVVVLLLCDIFYLKVKGWVNRW